MPVAAVIQAVVGAPVPAGGAVALAEPESAIVAFGALLADEPAADTPEWADLYAQAEARVVSERERIEREQLRAQGLWQEFLRTQGEDVPEGERSLVADDDLHRQLQRLARSAAAAEYERENVIGDPNQTFGIEIEFDGADPNAVAQAFYDAGLAATPHQEAYHSGQRMPGKWVIERDATVTGEVVSPVLRDTPEAWAELERVCQILRDQGAHTTTRTGGHVHVGADSANLDHDVNRFRRVAEVCAWAEDLMYRLAAGSGRGGRQHRGAGNGYRWCGPMGTGRFEEAQSLSDLAYRVGSSHGVGLNYGNLLEQRRTIEYRYFDSSLDPARLQANIKLACWVTKRAAELPDSAIPAERHRLGSHVGGQSSDQGDGLLRRFADLVFVRPKDKLKLYWLYERSTWQRGRTAA
ncbi:MAG: amidoligase family protein [Candidatus Dormibacterales bacterium]